MRQLDADGLGLPPPARGAPSRGTGGRCWRRSTPACAGSTTESVASMIVSEVYPRLRGEHALPVERHG